MKYYVPTSSHGGMVQVAKFDEAYVQVSDHEAEVARLRAEVEKVRGYEVAPLEAKVAELRAELEAYKSLVCGIVDNRHKCFIPTDDPNSPTFNWDERADAAMGADA